MDRAAVWEQQAYRAREDDGSETAANWKEPVNTPWEQQVLDPFRVRFVVAETNNADPPVTFAGHLQYRLNGATWVLLDGNQANAIHIIDSTHFTRNDDTTQQISSGPYHADNNAMQDSPTGGESCWITTGTHANVKHEAEYCLRIQQEGVADADLIELRVVRATISGSTCIGTAAVLDTYTQTPQITVRRLAPGLRTRRQAINRTVRR